ncbi:MAG: DNA polymerase II small subunit, partial [Candidatus Nitrosomaritimum yanchengensis]
MKKELTFALNKGFQIHPDAFKILENLDVKKLEKIVKEIVREKAKQKLFLINQDDLETYLGIKEDQALKNDHKILSDPTSRITTGEGVKGYNALFS